jgi:acyl-CoA thioester hydrolase
MARTEWRREMGRSYRELEDEDGVAFPVVRAGARYRASARYDERLEVTAKLESIGASRIRFEYELRRLDEPDRVLATGFTEHATVGRDGRPIRMPDELHRRLTEKELAS